MGRQDHMQPTDLFRWDLAQNEDSLARGSSDQRDGDQGSDVGAPQVEELVAESVANVERVEPAAITPGQRTPRTLDDVSAPVLVHAMRGSIDAGHAGSMVVTHLLESHPTTRIATFDVDELVDYRSRRPAMTFDRTAWTDYAEPVLALDHLATESGGLLLLHGLEPDLRWEAFSQAMRSIIERLGVRTTVAVHGIPMGVPHTRPISVTSHGTREGLVDGGNDIFGLVSVPGSASSLLEYRLGGWGHDAMGFAVHVPHYLAQSEYPAAASELVRQISRVVGEQIDTTSLDEAAAAVVSEIDRQVVDSPEVAGLVSALETQYDAFQEAAGRSLLASGDVPSADEIAAQFEAFLAEQDGRDAGATSD
mgnify:CR=1 FL=1